MCVLRQLYADVLIMHPEVNFVSDADSNTPGGLYMEMETVYRELECGAIVWSLQSLKRELTHANAMCQLGLFASSLIYEIPVSFPVRENMIGALSHYIKQLELVTPFARFDNQPYTHCLSVENALARQSRQQQAGRRLTVSGGGRAGGRSGAAAAGGDSGGPRVLEWTEEGDNAGGDSGQLDIGHLSSAFVLFIVFFGAAVARSLYEELDTEEEREEVKKAIDEAINAAKENIEVTTKAIEVNTKNVMFDLSRVISSKNLPVPAPVQEAVQDQEAGPMTLKSGEVEEEAVPPRASPDKVPSRDGLPTMQATLLTGRDGLPLSSTSPAIPLATVANEEVLPRGAGALEAAWAGAALEAASRGPGPSSISFQASGLNAVAVESPGSDAGSARVRTRTRTRRSRSRSDSSPSPSPRNRCQDGGAPDASSVAPSV